MSDPIRYIHDEAPKVKWPRKLRILAVPPNEGGCAYYRVINPCQKLQELYPDLVEIKFDKNPLGFNAEQQKWDENFDHENLKWADVVFTCNISNFGGPYTARVIGKARELGKFVHFDTDDLLTDLYEEHKLHKVYEEMGLSEITKFLYNNSDLVTVTQKKFLERIQPFCTKIVGVVKNAIDYELPCWNMKKPQGRKRVHIGWAGGIHHNPDVSVFRAIPHLANQKIGREKIHWDFCGHPPSHLKDQEKEKWQFETWAGYRKAFTSGFKGQKNWMIHNAMPPNQYGAMYAYFDIAIAPLQNNLFNDSKSDIKVAECSRYGVPLVCSDVGCYNETIIDGVTGYLIPDGASKSMWVDRIKRIATDKKLRKQMSETLINEVSPMYDLNKVVGRRLTLYDQVFETLNYDPFK